MDNILHLVGIFDDVDYNNLSNFYKSINTLVSVEEEAEYTLKNHLTGYHCVEIKVDCADKDKKETAIFLAKALPYICLRFEDSPAIFVTNEADLIDLKLDIYNYPGYEEEYLKDMLTIKERYNLIFKSSKAFDETDKLCLFDNYLTDTYVDLDENSKELFDNESSLTIMNESTGETRLVDIILGIPDDYYTIMVFKKLEKKD